MFVQINGENKMKKNLITIAFTLFTSAISTQLYAKDIRYVYCTANFIEHGTTNSSNPVRQNIIRLFSPIFQVNVHNTNGASSVNLSGDFENTILRDSTNAKGTFAYEWIKNVGLHQRGCNFESTSLQQAKQKFDQEYINDKDFKPNLQDRCKYIGVYTWIPEEHKPLYPNVTEAEFGYKALVQGCFPEKPVRYKNINSGISWFK